MGSEGHTAILVFLLARGADAAEQDQHHGTAPKAEGFGTGPDDGQSADDAVALLVKLVRSSGWEKLRREPETTIVNGLASEEPQKVLEAMANLDDSEIVHSDNFFEPCPEVDGQPTFG